ncbi:MAG TPA: nuclear transport factor 2 family protein [Anaeromyxobacter sp.]|nr:nuclear transport factor 2 family protein [Anaeromyxobacter sp.]
MPVSSTVVVERQLEAYNAQNVEALVATYADDIVITTSSKGEVLVQGKDALRKQYASLFEKFPRSHCRVAERRTEGDKVVLDHEIITGRGPDMPDPWDVGWVRYEVEGGLIRRVQLPRYT